MLMIHTYPFYRLTKADGNGIQDSTAQPNADGEKVSKFRQLLRILGLGTLTAALSISDEPIVLPIDSDDCICDDCEEDALATDMDEILAGYRARRAEEAVAAEKVLAKERAEAEMRARAEEALKQRAARAQALEKSKLAAAARKSEIAARWGACTRCKTAKEWKVLLGCDAPGCSEWVCATCAGLHGRSVTQARENEQWLCPACSSMRY